MTFAYTIMPVGDDITGACSCLDTTEARERVGAITNRPGAGFYLRSLRKDGDRVFVGKRAGGRDVRVELHLVG